MYDGDDIYCLHRVKRLICMPTLMLKTNMIIIILGWKIITHLDLVITEDQLTHPKLRSFSRTCKVFSKCSLKINHPFYSHGHWVRTCP